MHPISRVLRLSAALAAAATMAAAPAGAAGAAAALTGAPDTPAPIRTGSAVTCDLTISSNGTTDQLRDVVHEQLAEGQTLCLKPGTYRISDTIYPKAGTTIYGPRTAVVSGAKVVTGWQRTGATWTVTGQLPPSYPLVGECEDNETNLCRWAENVFVDGRKLERVSSADLVRPGTVYADYDTNTVVIGTDPTGATVEMASAQRAIQPTFNGTVLRGFTVQRFANPGQQGALMVERSNTVLDDLTVTENHGPGVTFNNSLGAKLVNSRVVANGQLGVSVYRAVNTEVARNEISRNNTDGFWINDWESGGLKVTFKDVNVHNNVVADNKGIGLWADAYARHVTFRENIVRNNGAEGIRYEISYDGVITRNVVTGNGFARGRGSAPMLINGGGVTAHNVQNVTISENLLRNNLHGVGVQMRARYTDPEPGSGQQPELIVTRNVRVERNVEDLRNGAQTGVVGMADTWEQLSAGIRDGSLGIVFDNNTYLLPSRTAKQFVYGVDRPAPAYTFREWQRFGFDRRSLAR